MSFKVFGWDVDVTFTPSDLKINKDLMSNCNVCSNPLPSKSGWEWLLLHPELSQLAIKDYVLGSIGRVRMRWPVGRRIPHLSTECYMPSSFKIVDPILVNVRFWWWQTQMYYKLEYVVRTSSKCCLIYFAKCLVNLVQEHVWEQVLKIRWFENLEQSRDQFCRVFKKISAWFNKSLGLIWVLFS